MTDHVELIPGTLDLMVLKTLSLTPLHGVAIADRIEQVTKGVFAIGPGSLFPSLHRLTRKGWIEGEWIVLDDGRRIKTYRLTAAGRSQLTLEKRNWRTIINAMERILTEEA